MEVRCSVTERTVLSVVVLGVERIYMVLIPSSIDVREGTWLRSTHIKEVKLEVMLHLGLIHRVQQQPSNLRGTSSMP